MNEQDLIVVIRIDKDTRKPNYEFKGSWSGRWAKLAIAKMPKAYRQYMAKKLKDLELEKKVIETIESEGVKEDGTDTRTSEPGRTTADRRTGVVSKRVSRVKKGSRKTKTGKRTDTKGKTRLENKPVVPETTAGTGKAAAGSAADEQKPSSWPAAFKRTDGADDRT